jgi:hypothetical protein
MTYRTRKASNKYKAIRQEYRCIELYGHYYTVYSDGRLFDIEKRYFKKHNPNGNGYVFYRFRNGRKQHNIYVHRLVAKNFIPNPHGYTEVNHIDCNKINNDVSNLEWCSRSMNMRHGYANGLYKPVIMMGENNPASRKVDQLTLDGQQLATFDCISDAARKTNAIRQDISKVCKGKRKSSGGYLWRYTDK